MADILKKMREKAGFISMAGATEDMIRHAESSLGLKFHQEYRDYVSALGAATFESHELTGVCASPRLNVVEVTESERQKYPEVAKDWYVLEQLSIDDVSIWQASSGDIYQLMPGAQPAKLSSSLSEYIG
ncbi:MAG: SMI1/KNR4 family protein [Christensenellales bacterium]